MEMRNIILSTILTLWTVCNYSTGIQFYNKWTLLGRKCYWFNSNKKIQEQARTGCQSKGSALAVIETQKEFDTLVAYITTTEGYPFLFVALERPTIYHNYKWDDGTVPPASWWILPPGALYRCAVLDRYLYTSTYGLDNFSCTNAKAYICEKDPPNNSLVPLPNNHKTRVAYKDTTLSSATASSYCLLGVYDGLSRLQCAAECRKTSQCIMFGYDVGNSRCELYRMYSQNVQCSSILYRPHYLYYRMNVQNIIYMCT